MRAGLPSSSRRGGGAFSGEPLQPVEGIEWIIGGQRRTKHVDWRARALARCAHCILRQGLLTRKLAGAGTGRGSYCREEMWHFYI